MEQVFLIVGVLLLMAIGLYCVRLLDKAWTSIKNRPAKERPVRRPAEHHEEIKLPRR